MKKFSSLAIICLLLIFSAVSAEPGSNSIEVLPFVSIGANFEISQNSDVITTYSPNPDFPYAPELAYDYTEIDQTGLLTAGVSVEKSNFIASIAFGAPFAEFDSQFNPTLDIGAGWKYRDILAYGGYFTDLKNDCEYDLGSSFYTGLQYGIPLNSFALSMGIQYKHGSLNNDGRDYNYDSYSLYNQLSIELGYFEPYISLAIDYWGLTEKTYAYLGAGVTLGWGRKVQSRLNRHIKANVRPGGDMVLKPNIYLYPETACDVSVTIEPNGFITTSIPEYGEGWNVVAHPNGTITGTDNFLFYEASIAYDMPSEGFCFSQSQLMNKLVILLQNFGFNEKEIMDFVEYWAVSLPEAPYYNVHILGNRELDKICPLTVNPKPDNILRIWFVFEPTDKFVNLKSPKIEKFDRDKFVVTEWGGIIAD